MGLEFIQRLEADGGEERWLVQVEPEAPPCVLWILCDTSDDQWLGRVARQTEKWIGFHHPRVGRVHELRWLDGPRLAAVVDDDRGPAFADAAAQLADTPHDRERWAVAQIITIADALATMAAVQPGFVHNRLDAHRLFVDPTGHARLRAPVELVSLGERRETRTGTGALRGTPSFLSPEQARGVALTPASDVFSLAGNLAYALTGRRPFHAETMMEELMAILQAPAPDVPTYAPGLDAVLARAFAKDPAERYATPGELGAALYECIPDAGEHDAVTSDRIAAWWPTSRDAIGPNHDLEGPRCSQRWEELEGTGDVRHCRACDQPVVRVTSPLALLPLLGRSCVSYRPD